MKIVIAGGHNEADFLIRMFKKQRHTSLVVINAENSYCRRLSSTHNIPVYAGDPSKTYVLSDAGAEGADVAIALTRRDSDNFVICQLGVGTQHGDTPLGGILCRLGRSAHAGALGHH